MGWAVRHGEWRWFYRSSENKRNRFVCVFGGDCVLYVKKESKSEGQMRQLSWKVQIISESTTIAEDIQRDNLEKERKMARTEPEEYQCFSNRGNEPIKKTEEAEN